LIDFIFERKEEEKSRSLRTKRNTFENSSEAVESLINNIG
jgi:hypothetical protein